MTNNFYPPITPTPELVKQWCYEGGDEVATSPRWFHIVCTKAARWGADQQLDLDAEQINQAWQKGADQELEACCEWLDAGSILARELRLERRPTPPNLKAQAMSALYAIATGADDTREFHQDIQTIKDALDSLSD